MNNNNADNNNTQNNRAANIYKDCHSQIVKIKSKVNGLNDTILGTNHVTSININVNNVSPNLPFAEIKIIYGDELVKLKINQKIKVKTLLENLRTKLNIKKDRILFLFRDDKQFIESEDITVKIIKENRNEFLLAEGINFSYVPPIIVQSEESSRKLKSVNNKIKEPSPKKSRFPKVEIKQQEINKINEKLIKLIQQATKASTQIVPIPKKASRKEDFGFFIVDQDGTHRHINLGQASLQEFLDFNSSDSEAEFSLDEGTNSDPQNESNTYEEGVDLNSRPHTHAHFPIEPRPLYDHNLVNRLVEMGFEVNNARIALRISHNNLDEAAHYLMNAPDFFFAENAHLAGENNSFPTRVRAINTNPLEPTTDTTNNMNPFAPRNEIPREENIQVAVIRADNPLIPSIINNLQVVTQNNIVVPRNTTEEHNFRLHFSSGIIDFQQFGGSGREAYQSNHLLLFTKF